jgi:lipopolysaccharide biosynthesis glycosyltransferase
MSVLHVSCSCAADGAYAPHSAAMLDSVLEHAGGLDVSVHYLHGPGFPGRTAELIEGMVNGRGGSIAFTSIPDERVEGLPTMAFEGVPSSLWYRVFLAELLPEVDRVLYLDADTIAVDSLAPLWETELGDHYLAAVTNVFMREHAGRAERLGLSGPEAYFNTGVMLLNLELWRRDGLAGAICDYARANSERLGWADQDTMNILLGERRLRLHPRWNVMNSVVGFPWAEEVFGAEAVAEARANPGIRHFEGPSVNKPWHPGCERAMRDLYLEHRRRTPWPELSA